MLCHQTQLTMHNYVASITLVCSNLFAIVGVTVTTASTALAVTYSAILATKDIGFSQ